MSRYARAAMPISIVIGDIRLVTYHLAEALFHATSNFAADVMLCRIC